MIRAAQVHVNPPSIMGMENKLKMTDKSGHMNRPGAGPSSSNMFINGIPLNVYINHNSQTGRVEIAKPMPPDTLDEVVKDFPDEESAWEWARQEFNARRLPL
jgi:hypothetical protein